MKKIIPLLTTFMLLGVCSVSAQTNSPNSLLWEISGKGLKQPSYLFGTIHVICKEDFVLSDSILKKWENADHVFLELDLDDPKLQMELM